MDNPNIFTEKVANQVIDRINKLTPTTKAQWGKMNVAQMLAHCNVTYETVYTDKHPKPNAIVGFLIRSFVKNIVVSNKPYPKNGRTAPIFIITDERELEKEKKILTDYINKTQKLGEAHFNGKENLSFGNLNKNEWNNLFYKHLDHHLNQFGV